MSDEGKPNCGSCGHREAHHNEWGCNQDGCICGEEYKPARTLEEKRDWALAGKARWEAKLVRAEAAQQRADEMGGGMLGFGGSGNQRAARQVRAAFSSADRAWREATEKLGYYSGKLDSYERRIAERDRKRLTREDIVGAVLVRDQIGWRRVVRINKTTVSVKTPYSWTDRIEFDKILEFRTDPALVPGVGQNKGEGNG